MSKYLAIKSCATDTDGKSISGHCESDIFPIERIMNFGFNYDHDGYSLTVQVNDDEYNYYFSEVFSEYRREEIVKNYINFLEDTERMLFSLDLTRYQG